MKKLIKSNGLFLSLSAIVFAGLGILLLTHGKAELHLWLNSYHTAFGDFFFRYYTYIAAFGIYLAAFIMLFWRLGASLYLLAGEVVGGIIVQIAKHLVQAPRPKVFFDLANHPDAIPLVEGVQLHSSNSFPSGHASTSFVLFFILAIVLNYYGKQKAKNQKLIQAFCFLLALTGAYARIYLSQHFAADVLAGGIIGMMAVIMLFPAFEWLNNKHPKLCAWHIVLRQQTQPEDLDS